MAGFGPFEHRPAIAVGVSGGPDSTALALLLQDWLAAREGRLLALVVDHRLRPESAAEVKLVAARLAGLGIEARVLTLSGPLPTAGLQAAARAARYALLEAAAAEAGILHLAVAHHARDQAETIALRRAAGSGPRGAAGMPALRELDRVRLIRPLLHIAPDRVRALLEQRGVPWIEDPSNRDTRFWRARYRLAGGGMPTTPPAGADRGRLERASATLLARHARPHPLGFVGIELAALGGLEEPLLAALLGRLVLATAGSAWPPGSAELARLAAWLHRCDGARRALGGVLIERAGSALRFVREPRAVEAPRPLLPGELLWDGRFRIVRHGAGPALQVRAAGPGWRRRLARMASADVDTPEAARLPAVVLETLPLVGSAERALRLGPWCLDPDGRHLDIRFRPQNRLSAVPFA